MVAQLAASSCLPTQPSSERSPGCMTMLTPDNRVLSTRATSTVSGHQLGLARRPKLRLSSSTRTIQRINLLDLHSLSKTSPHGCAAWPGWCTVRRTTRSMPSQSVATRTTSTGIPFSRPKYQSWIFRGQMLEGTSWKAPAGRQHSGVSLTDCMLIHGGHNPTPRCV